eukprot:CAMPEP_0117875876 /NCGR_PEP_ID=MMETSP0950-20121206/13221_1 /TAXON_ID=44440 /ORGANISM="Chattonella subsalsa, Strain CCMP2191" /LENGTH=232 /DNA_ID=CAMNT_0005729487 /DNA_START=5 /DNA_END=703 /DNA_ORIENTATION=-
MLKRQILTDSTIFCPDAKHIKTEQDLNTAFNYLSVLASHAPEKWHSACQPHELTLVATEIYQMFGQIQNKKEQLRIELMKEQSEITILKAANHQNSQNRLTLTHAQVSAANLTPTNSIQSDARSPSSSTNSAPVNNNSPENQPKQMFYINVNHQQGEEHLGSVALASFKCQIFDATDIVIDRTFQNDEKKGFVKFGYDNIQGRDTVISKLKQQANYDVQIVPGADFWKIKVH